MSQQKTKTTTGTKFWSLNLRPKVGITVTHNLREWINTSGANSEPDENSNDWEAITDDLSALKQNTESLFGIREPSNPQIVQSPIPVDLFEETEYLVGKNENGQDIMMQRVSFDIPSTSSGTETITKILKNRNGEDISSMQVVKTELASASLINAEVGGRYYDSLPALNSVIGSDQTIFQLTTKDDTQALFGIFSASLDANLKVVFDIYYKDTLF